MVVTKAWVEVDGGGCGGAAVEPDGAAVAVECESLFADGAPVFAVVSALGVGGALGVA
jgi:hypothetical protein